MPTREHQVDVLLVGGGVASVRCARTLRRRRYEGSILLVGSERAPPYNRPPLSKELLRGEVPAELVLAEQPDWYERQRVELWTDATVASLDLDERRAVLADGRVIRYGRCVLATGAVPRRPPIPGTEHALLLRTLGDAERLRDAAAAGARAVVIGGGFIGVEVASSLAERGAAVTVLELAPALWGGVLGEELSEWAASRLRAAGIDLRLGVAASHLEAGAVWVGDERLPADVTLAGVGVTPAVELAVAAGLEVCDGIVVDERHEASRPGVFAAGDVASSPHPLADGAHIRVEHWHAARESGERAALALLGEALPARRAPWVFSEVAGVAVDVVGWGPEWDATARLGRGDAFTLAYLRGSRVVQAAIVGGHLPVDSVRSLAERAGDVGALRELAASHGAGR
jgi:3-phenylpropionate/trans-cinnamate dioxygenase ferredoxin reductase component